MPSEPFDYAVGVTVGLELGRLLVPQHQLVADWKQYAADLMVDGVKHAGPEGDCMLAAGRAVASCAYQLEASLIAMRKRSA